MKYGLSLWLFVSILILVFLLNSRRYITSPPIYAMELPRSFQVTNHFGSFRYRIAELNDSDYQNKLAEFNTRKLWTNDLKIMSYFHKRFQDSHYDWRQSISFWGIVLDQNDSPINDASIELVWSDLSTNGTSEINLKSDKSGKFCLLNKMGKGLSVRAKKEGYRGCHDGFGSFEYANPTDRAYHRPDPDLPVAFHLIKRGPPEPMVQRGRMELRCAEDTGDLFVDLLGYREIGRDDPSVDLTIHAEHGPIRTVDGGPWYRWRIVLSVPNGGIQTGSDCPPSAPEEGYEPSLTFQGNVEGRHGGGVVDGWFFLKCRGGQHYVRAWMKISAAPYEGGTPRVYISEYVLNPSGSRNLEFYPEMQVEAKYYVPRDR